MTDIFYDWRRQWLTKRATRKALQHFKSATENKGPSEVTLYRIEQACFLAALYKPEIDRGKVYRESLQREVEQLQPLSKAAHLLARAARNNLRGLMWACTDAELRSGIRIRRTGATEPEEILAIFADYMCALEVAFESRLPEISRGGPWLNKYVVGNLISDSPISRGRPVTVETMLGYEIVFHMRMLTAGHGSDPIQLGQPMPTYGDPCYEVAVLFCDSVLGRTWDAKALGDKVRRLKGVCLYKWPDAE
jgi:hypothetical protein